jgi:hypothetical protein
MSGERRDCTFIEAFMLVDKVRERNNFAANTPLNLRNLFPTCRLLLAASKSQSEAKDKM